MKLSGIYRPGYPFTSVELQSMVQHGALRHLIADVYAEACLIDSPTLRATGAYALLSSRLRRHGTLCGETAAWVYLNHQAPERITVNAADITSRQAATGTGGWQLHRTALSPSEQKELGPALITTGLRTAADIFCGVGVLGCRKALDRIGAERGRLQHWPAVLIPLQGRDEDLSSLGESDQRKIQHRWETIAALCREFQLKTDELANTILRIVSRTRWDTDRLERVTELLDYGVSRRLPTVR